MTKRRVCGTCGHGATSKVLENLKPGPLPPPNPNRKKPPRKKSNKEKAQLLALAIVKGMNK
jgi:hypothetical protein